MPWAPLYVDAAELAEFVRVNETNPYVATYGAVASRAVDGFCNRQFGQMAEAVDMIYESHRATRMLTGRWLLQVHDLQLLTGLAVTVDGTTVTAGADGYQLWPRNAALEGRPYTALTLADQPCGDVVVTGRPGWSTVPDAVTAAVWLQVNAWNVRRESPMGVGGGADAGTEVTVTGSRRLDPDVRAMLSHAELVRARMPL